MKNTILTILLLPAIAGLSQKPLFTSTSKHPFSEQIKNDSFVLTLTGRSVLKGDITFHIYKNSRIIFTDTFPAADLTRNGSDDPGDIPADFKPVLAEIRSNRSAIGLVYSHRYEGTYAITWSKKKAKAQFYYSSD